MKVTSVDCHILVVRERESSPLETALDNVVVEIHTDENITGIGEVESNPWVVQAFIHSSGAHTMDHSLGKLLIGKDPQQPQAIWNYLYEKSLLAGRRGAGINAIGALDMAIWDAFGKYEKQPIWKLLGGTQHSAITPYASLLPLGYTLRSYQGSMIEKIRWARFAGFKAVKIEVMIKGPHAHPGLQESDDAIVETVAMARAELGPDIQLMVDVGYCWNDWKEALRVIQRIEKYDIYFVECPLPPDNFEDLGRLSRACDMRIAAGELLTTRLEFEALVRNVDVLQPDVGRVGGITETMRVVELAAAHGKLVVPHCWKSGIGIAATAQIAAFAPNCPYFEYAPAEVSDSPIRRELVTEVSKLKNGQFPLPGLPGLGVRLNPDAMQKFSISSANPYVESR